MATSLSTANRLRTPYVSNWIIIFIMLEYMVYASHGMYIEANYVTPQEIE